MATTLCVFSECGDVLGRRVYWGLSGQFALFLHAFVDVWGVLRGTICPASRRLSEWRGMKATATTLAPTPEFRHHPDGLGVYYIFPSDPRGLSNFGPHNHTNGRNGGDWGRFRGVWGLIQGCKGCALDGPWMLGVRRVRWYVTVYRR